MLFFSYASDFLLYALTHLSSFILKSLGNCSIIWSIWVSNPFISWIFLISFMLDFFCLMCFITFAVSSSLVGIVFLWDLPAVLIVRASLQWDVKGSRGQFAFYLLLQVPHRHHWLWILGFCPMRLAYIWTTNFPGAQARGFHFPEYFYSLRA